MFLVHAIFELAPWYVWALVVVALIAVTYLGLWAPVMAFLAKVPREFWIAGAAIVAILIAFNVWLDAHDEGIRADDAKKYEAREKAANEAAEKRAAALARQLELATAAAAIAAEKSAKEAAQREAALHQRITALEKARQTDVTPEANRRCDLTRGVVLHFNAGAAAANEPAGGGESAAAPGADRGDVDASAGVSLDTFAGAIEQTQSALGTCRNQVTSWQTYHATVITPWIDKVTAALSSCIPQGASP